MSILAKKLDGNYSTNCCHTNLEVSNSVFSTRFGWYAVKIPRDLEVKQVPASYIIKYSAIPCTSYALNDVGIL